ncbi:MAG: hypothetical protein ABIH46_05315, partial [Chloroflexota bacterium]
VGHMNAAQWEQATGDICPGCGDEMFRVLELPMGGNGCRNCFAGDQHQMERKVVRRYFLRGLKQGQVRLKDIKEGKF